MALSDAACRAAKPGLKLQKLSDSGGLQLWVMPTGSRLWRLAYRFAGKQKLLSLGAYPVFSLAEARRARDEAKKQMALGRDPADLRKQQKSERQAVADTFKAVAADYVAKLKREGRAEATLVKKNWLLAFAYPTLGDKRVSEIRPVDCLAVLRQVEERGCYETAKRLRATVGAVCRYAIATARADVDPTSALRGALTSPVVTPRAAVTDARKFGGLLRAIAGFDGQPTTRAGLQLMALLFPRPGELRFAEWTEFDFAAAVWTVPAARTKMRREHCVPLAAQAIQVLRELQAVTGSGQLLLPSVRSASRPISENTLNAGLRRLGYAKDEATAHGFRATASTLLNEFKEVVGGRHRAAACARRSQ